MLCFGNDSTFKRCCDLVAGNKDRHLVLSELVLSVRVLSVRVLSEPVL